MQKHSVYIGDKLKKARKALRVSQTLLAERVGISYQQIQKYEKGQSEITISRLYQIAAVLHIDPVSLLPTKEMMIAESPPGYEKGRSKKVPLSAGGFIAKDEAVLLNFFREIKNKKIKNGLLMLIKGIAEAESK